MGGPPTNRATAVRTMAGMPVTDRPKPPAPTCAPAYVGPCQGCQESTHRYGPGGNPLCSICTRDLETRRAAR